MESNFFFTKVRNNKKTIAATVTGLFLAVLFNLFPAPADRTLNLQNYLITVGGIISAFVIAYLSAKIFNIRAEREGRQRVIDAHSEKITDYRRLIYFVMKSPDLWVHYEDIQKFQSKYPGLTYQMLHDHQTIHEYASAVWDETELSTSTIDLYCAMLCIYGNPNSIKNNYWQFDKFATFHYSIEYLSRIYDPSNQIWYYLLGRFGKYGEGHFNDRCTSILWKESVDRLLPKFNPKYKGIEFNREILAEISTEIYELIPTIIKLTKNNTGVPRIVLKTCYSLMAIMAFGVVFPIVIQSIEISDKFNTLYTLTCVGLTIVSIVIFMLDFLDFINQDVHIVISKTN